MSPPALTMRPLERPPDAEVPVPGSKSHTNRALLCAGLAAGRSELAGALFADDTEAMMGALEQLGVGVDRRPSDAAVIVDGGPPGRARPEVSPVHVDVRQSGTTGRFLLPVLATMPGRYVLDGDRQLRSRPFGPQLAALRALGARIDGDRLPLSLAGGALAGGEVVVDGSLSSQFLSGLLLAAPRLSSALEVVVDGALVSHPYVQLTIDVMAAFGVTVDSADDRRRFIVRPARYRPASIEVEPDASAASYLFAAAAVTGGRVRVPGLGSGTVQGDLRFVHLLEKMGAEVRIGTDWTEVRGPDTLMGITADLAELSDTAQTLAVVATFAATPSEITGIGFIRHKETDRVAAVATELGRRGIGVTQTDDGWIIEPGRPEPGVVRTYDDHRMAMSFAILGLVHPGIQIENPGCVAKTFPRFFQVLDGLRA